MGDWMEEAISLGRKPGSGGSGDGGVVFGVFQKKGVWGFGIDGRRVCGGQDGV